MKRKVINKVSGYRTKDGAGVSLVRVLGNTTVRSYDPLLMLDSFDSTNYDDYKAGFPTHPHRGIETVSYLYKGKMTHKDTMGNEDTIKDGEVQWMTAGSGLMHSEMLPESDRVLGVQVWLNLPRKYKMCKPEYRAIKIDEIKEIKIDDGKLRLLCGRYKNYQGYQTKYLPLDFYDIHLNENSRFEIDVEDKKSITLFSLVGDIRIEGERIEEKTAVKLSEGEKIVIESLDNKCQILFLSSDKLDEPIAWGGPVVMNTEEEILIANNDLRNGTFIKEEAKY